jgi:hypothetical protein
MLRVVPTPVAETITYPADFEAMNAPACTLDRGALGERIAEWAALRERSLLERTDTGQTRRSRWSLEGLTELRRLVAAEHQCCPFLAFQLTVGPQTATLETRFPEGASPQLFAEVG